MTISWRRRLNAAMMKGPRVATLRPLAARIGHDAAIAFIIGAVPAIVLRTVPYLMRLVTTPTWPGGDHGVDAWGVYGAAFRRVIDGQPLYEANPGPVSYLNGPPAVVLFPTAGLLPHDAAIWVTTGLMAGLYALTVWLLVPRWRVWIAAASLFYWPTLLAVFYGNSSLIIAAGIGLAWHWRERPARSALILTAPIYLKVYPCMLATWLVLSRRFRTVLWLVGWLLAEAAVAVLFLGPGVFPSWFRTLYGYGPRLTEANHASIVGVLTDWVGYQPAFALQLLGLGIVMLAAARARDDAGRFGAAVGAMLCAAPFAFEHYLAVVPIALVVMWRRPLASAVILVSWVIPVLLPFASLGLAYIAVMPPSPSPRATWFARRGLARQRDDAVSTAVPVR